LKPTGQNEAGEPSHLEEGHLNLDFVIIGGGILGAAIAAGASQLGLRVLVLRRGDNGVPRADTLRNQGWLQSGLCYRLKAFSSESEYRIIAEETFRRGRELMFSCGLRPSTARGIARVSAQGVEELLRKAELLRLGESDFRHLGSDEALRLLGELYEGDSEYFLLPDTPFDEAAVLEYFRALAEEHGAQFLELDAPVTFERDGLSMRIRSGDFLLESPLTLVAAGAGSLELIRQLGVEPPVMLRRTPLLVQPGTQGMECSLYVDHVRKVSIVRHTGGAAREGALVVGTNVRMERPPDVPPEARRITLEEVTRFQSQLPPTFQRLIGTGRFTAGYEVIPIGKTEFEVWVQDYGSVVTASPGRATLVLGARDRVLPLMLKKRAEMRGAFRLLKAGATRPWKGQILMHFSHHYSFNDVETGHALSDP
jgi:glycine/D-amino acid oxidase-like deaminating enzyme